MANSLHNCESCPFGEISPAQSRFVLSAESTLVADHIHVDGDPRRQRSIKQFEAAVSDRVDSKRLKAARACAKAYLDGVCNWSDKEKEN